MILRKGEMFKDFPLPDIVYCITANSFITQSGELVMGRGAAKQLRRLRPMVPQLAGSKIPHLGNFGLIFIDVMKTVALFQVKREWWKRADITLITYSTEMLRSLAEFCNEVEFWLNFPGIGSGGLSREDVLLIISRLPDNVVVWEFR